jgi:hypothetical protein
MEIILPDSMPLNILVKSKMSKWQKTQMQKQVR